MEKNMEHEMETGRCLGVLNALGFWILGFRVILLNLGVIKG